MARKCIVCGNDNNTLRSKFCCNTCKQKYYYQKNKEQRLENNRQYYKEHKEQIDKKHADWIENNRDRWNDYLRSYRRAEKEQGGNQNE